MAVPPAPLFRSLSSPLALVASSLSSPPSSAISLPPTRPRSSPAFSCTFYFAINLGSVCSTLITPSIRSHWSYAAAFGLPAILLFVATLIFIAGKRRYRRVPPAGSVVSRSLGAIFLALWRKTKSAVSSCSARRYAPLEPVEHWLDHARDRYGDVIITDLRGALRAAAIFIPLPAFWALFDQHASRFIFQASQMDLNVFGFQDRGRSGAVSQSAHGAHADSGV
jgi:dipeptide/tripeptide permease